MEFDFNAQWGIQAGRCITKNGLPFVSLYRCTDTAVYVEPTQADALARKIVEWLQGEALSKQLAKKGATSAAAKRASYLRNFLPGDPGYTAARIDARKRWPDPAPEATHNPMPW
jgi:hypothetical protein